MFGTALLYGDGLITPAISVLSAVEGFEVGDAGVRALGDPDRRASILVGLFVVQRRGTGAVGKVFGPVMMVWFATIGVARPAARSPAPGRARGRQPDLRVELFGRSR